MTYPSFAVGDVLTASDMNAVGLWKVGSGSFSAATSHTVSNCFSSSYDHYRIVISVYGNANDAVDMVLRTTTDDNANNYFRYGFYWTTAANNLTQNNDTKIFMTNATNNATYPVGISIDMFNPNKALNTTYTLSSVETTTGFLILTGGVKVTNTQYTGFKIVPRVGTTQLTGNVTVYGYKP